MGNKRGRSEVDELRDQLRIARSHIKSLKKALARADKNARTAVANNIVDDCDEDIPSDVVVHTEATGTFCPTCKSIYSPKTIGNRMIHVCNGCGKKWSTKV